LTPQGNVRLGVSNYFERQLKGIVYVGNFKERDNVSEDEPFGTIETVAPYPFVIHDLYSPKNRFSRSFNLMILIEQESFH